MKTNECSVSIDIFEMDKIGEIIFNMKDKFSDEDYRVINERMMEVNKHLKTSDLHRYEIIYLETKVQERHCEGEDRHFHIYTERRRIELLESEMHRHHIVARGGDKWTIEDIREGIRLGRKIKFDPPVNNANISTEWKPHLYFEVSPVAEWECFDTEDYEGEDTDSPNILITPPGPILLSIRKLIT